MMFGLAVLAVYLGHSSNNALSFPSAFPQKATMNFPNTNFLIVSCVLVLRIPCVGAVVSACPLSRAGSEQSPVKLNEYPGFICTESYRAGKWVFLWQSILFIRNKAPFYPSGTQTLFIVFLDDRASLRLCFLDTCLQSRAVNQQLLRGMHLSSKALAWNREESRRTLV